MSDHPGYFKPLPGRRSRVPRDYVFCKRPDGTLEKVPRNVTVVYDHLGRRYGAYVGPVSCPPVPKTFKSKRRHKKFYTNGVSSRYRERNTNLERVGTIAPGTKLGLFKVFVNNQVSSSTQLNTTGEIKGSTEYWRCWDSLNPGPPFRHCSPFGLITAKVPGANRVTLSISSNQTSPGNWWQYDGDMVDNGYWGPDNVSNYLSVGVPVIVGYDTLAWDKLKPHLENANVGQFLIELRDMPHMLENASSHADDLADAYFRRGGRRHRDRVDVGMNPRRVADDFLNNEFGWVPFLSDVGKILSTYQDSRSIIADLIKRNGTWQRRRVTLDQSSTSHLLHKEYSPHVEPFGFQIQGICDTRNVDGIPCKGYMEIHEVVETKVWATGFFTFYRPEFDMNISDNYIGDLQRHMTIYGARVTPTLIWKVTPWTWLIDWFTKIGGYVQRLDDFVVDGIVSRNLCVMKQTVRRVTKTSVIFFQSGSKTFKWERSHLIKSRKVADSPYGFDQTWNNLSLRQWAILGAIGISRSPTGFISHG